MSEIEIPNFGVLLGPFIQKIPAESQPAFLAALERGAAQRYREWAAEAPEYEEQLRGCADREDEIARQADALFPTDDAGQAAILAVTPDARAAYYQVFAGLPLKDQWRIQASAERQGADAWRGIAAQQTDEAVIEVLKTCAALEEQSAKQLDTLLSS